MTLGSEGWIDVSVPVRDGMVHWPGHPPVEIGLDLRIASGDPANVTKVSMSAHTGTHIDAPSHFIEKGAGADEAPLDAMIGPARVIEISDPQVVTARELREHAVRSGERVILKTRNSARAWWDEEFDEGFVHLEGTAARHLAEVAVRLVGVDYLSIAGRGSGAETHLPLLRVGVWILEGLDLTMVGPGEYEMACLPLRVTAADGAPARVLLRPTG